MEHIFVITVILQNVSILTTCMQAAQKQIELIV